MQAGWAAESSEDEGLRATLRRLVLAAPMPTVARSSVICTTACSSTLSRSRSSCSSLRQAADSDPATPGALLEEMARDVQRGAGRERRGWRSASTRELLEAGGLAAAAALGRRERRRPCLRRRRRGLDLRPGDRDDGLPVLARRARARREARHARWRSVCAENGSARRSNSSRQGAHRTRTSTDCATASRRSAAS